jgi:hypothetical protein
MEVLRESVEHHVAEEESVLFKLARRHLDARALGDLGAQMQGHRDSVRGRGLVGVMTSVAEGTQAVIEGEQRLMDTATNVMRRAMRPAPPRRRTAPRRTRSRTSR